VYFFENPAMQHDSIKTLLNSLERETGKRLTHSELARALNVSEQVVTNWAKRGMSVEGALSAQFAFHKDANFILGRISHPMMYPQAQPGGTPPAPAYLAQEKATTYQALIAWPFSKTSVRQWSSLDPKKRELVEELIHQLQPA
jgi:hypothetical protein